MNLKSISKLRPITTSDEPFLWNSWLVSARFGQQWAHGVPHKMYFAVQKKIVTDLLKTSTVTLLVLRQEPTQIIGYAAHDDHHLHYVYVKQAYRRLGFAKLLLDEIGPRPFYTHHTRSAGYLCGKYVQAIFKPLGGFYDHEKSNINETEQLG